MEKMHTIYSDKRQSGIPLIDSLTWGTDFCQFFEVEEDLFDILIPYFRAGIENNELCIWIPSETLSTENEGKVLKKALPHLKEYIDKGLLEIVPEKSWWTRGGEINELIVSKLDMAILSGFDGLRLALTAFPEKIGLNAVSHVEIDVISRYNVIAAFSYPRKEFDAVSLMEAVKSHRFALVRNAGSWEIIESSEVRTIKDALKRSEEKLHSLFSNMSEGFAYHRIVLDAEGKPCDYIFHEVNEAFERLTGLKGENIIGRRATDTLPGIENDPTDWIGKYGQVALTGKPVQFENYSESLDKWYSVSAFSPHKGYFAVTFSDITERKRMEQALLESEEKLRVTLRSIGDAVIATDKNGLIAFMNPIAEYLTGWKLKQALKKKMEEVFTIINRDTRQPAENPIKRVILEGSIMGLANHTVLIARDGREIPIDDSAAPIIDDNENLIGVVLVFRDITEREKAEETLRRTKEEWELTFNTVPDLIAILDNQHRIIRVNRTMADRLGVTPDGCIGLHCYEVVHGMPEAPGFCPHSLTCADGREHVAEIREPRLNSDFLVSTSALRDEQGRINGTVHVARDITARKKAEQELRRAHDELENRVRERTSELKVSNKALMEYAAKLEKMNEELQDFTFAAAHDLQEPLRKIQTFSNMALMKCDTSMDSTGKEYIKRAGDSAERMRLLLRELLQFSRATTRPERLTEIDLDKMIRELADLFEEDIKNSGGLIEIKGMPVIKADKEQMRRLFQNLIGNALKFRSKQSPIINIYARHDGNQCQIFVEDNGIGFEPQFAERIFKPFQRLHGRKEYEGTGMGLSICRKIIESHGGDIRAESEPGKGSTFIVTIPEEHNSREDIL